MTALALAVMMACGPAVLPEDPVDRVATKAIRGDFGKLAGWQREGYQALLSGHRTMTAWRTFYSAHEGRQGQVDALGGRCDPTRTVAANALPMRSYVLFMGPKTKLRQVRDRGAKRNDRAFAHRRGLDLWIDEHTTDRRLLQAGGPVTIAVSRER